MRVNLLKFFALLLFLGMASAGFGQTPYTVINLTNTWRYNQLGVNLGSAWRATNYSDASWSSGRGAFAFATNSQSFLVGKTNTALSPNTGSGTAIETYYFRTTFTLTNAPYSISLYLSNMVDDAAVYYMNGVEFDRYNLPLAPTPITYFTDPSSVQDASSFRVVEVPSSVLVRGVNYLAVEVKNLTTSPNRDVVFGLAATVTYPTPTQLVITNQPDSLNVPEFSPATLSVGVSGKPITSIQWFKENSPIPGATNDLTLTFTNVTIADGGEYWVRLSNSVGAVTSQRAFLGIIADTNAPVLLAADGTESATNVVLTFNERLLASTATNISNYQITNLNGGTIGLSQVSLSANGSNVTLITSAPRQAGVNYLVVVNNVRDSSPHTNRVATNHSHPISTSISLINEMDWYYVYNPCCGDDAAPGSTWRNIGFNPYNNDSAHAWGDNEFGNRGIFYYGGNDLPGPLGITLQQTDYATIYFTRPMEFTASPLGVGLSLQFLADDGAVFYINGTEFYRHGLPAGTLTPNTPATRSSYPPPYLGPYSFAQMPIKSGVNNFAVELHTAGSLDTNYAFAARLSADISSYATGPVVITRQPTNTTVVEGQTATFTFFGAGPSRFQWYRNNTAINNETNATLTIPVATSALHSNGYHVVAMNSTHSATSSVARLFVVSDTIAPRLVSAYTISSNQILVSFSERMANNALTTSNYRITNRNGALTISGAVTNNNTNVLLTVSGGGAGTYVLVASNAITDASVAANRLTNDNVNAVTVGVQVTLPIDTTWKYNINGDDLGTAWRAVSYPAESSWPSGEALIADEDSALPAIINTPIPGNSPTTGNYLTNVYFRKDLRLATGGSNVTVSVRHIIDDGVVLYMNANEFHRFNMAAGAVLNSTFANVSVGEATWAGPFNTILTNVTGGVNMIAAETHQINGTSSDLVFGAEINLTAPSLRITNAPALPPRLVITSAGNNVSVRWTNQADKTTILQGTGALVGSNANNSTWTNISNGITVNGNVSTYTTTRTNRVFYRAVVQ